MVLGFKEQFVQPILEDIKLHTIREDVHDRWHEKRVAQMATGVRTKYYKEFAEKAITGVQFVFMTYTWVLEVSVGNSHYCDKYLTALEIEKLAINDGFKNRKELEDWFVPLIKANPKDLFFGKIIHWTDLRY